MTVLEHVKRLQQSGVKQKEASNGVSVEIPKREQEDLSECFPIKVPAKSEEYEKNTSEDADGLNFQPEPHAPFEQEPTYDVDAFQKNDRTVEKILTPPPNFKKALTQIPQPLKKAFKEILNGELVGVWPIGSDCLRK